MWNFSVMLELVWSCVGEVSALPMASSMASRWQPSQLFLSLQLCLLTRLWVGWTHSVFCARAVTAGGWGAILTMHYSQLGWSEALVAAGDVSLSSSVLLHAVVLRNCLGDIAERTQKFKCGTT